jgi:hypothetical protein
MTIGTFGGFSSNMKDDGTLAEVNGQSVGNSQTAWADWAKKSKIVSVDPKLKNLSLRDMLIAANCPMDAKLVRLSYAHSGYNFLSKSFSVISEKGEELGSGFTEKYQVINHHEVFESFLGFDSLMEMGCIPARVVNLDDGSKIVIQMILPDSYWTPNSEHKLFVNLWNSHDGKWGWGINQVDFRVVCQNTWRMAFTSDFGRFFGKHTKNAQDKIAAVAKAIGVIRGNFKKMGETMQKWSDVYVRTPELNEFLEYMIPAKDSNNDAAKNRQRDLAYKILCGTGQTEIPTKYSLFNGVTEYVDNRQQNRDDNEQLVYALFGSGAEMKDKAFNYLSR